MVAKQKGVEDPIKLGTFNFYSLRVDRDANVYVSIRANQDFCFVIPTVHTVEDKVRAMVEESGLPIKILTSESDRHDAFVASEVAIAASGTVVAVLSVVFTFVCGCCTGGTFTVVETILNFLLSYVLPTIIACVLMIYYGFKKGIGCRYTINLLGGSSVSF